MGRLSSTSTNQWPEEAPKKLGARPGRGVLITDPDDAARVIFSDEGTAAAFFITDVSDTARVIPDDAATESDAQTMIVGGRILIYGA